MERTDEAKARGEQERQQKSRPDTGEHGAAPAEQTTVRSKATVTPASNGALRGQRIVAASYQDTNADLFRMLRAQVLQHLVAVKGRTIGVCSARASEGKTLIAANLAVSIAMAAIYRSLLVDLDLRRPSAHQYFSFEPRHGLTDCLSRRASLPECLIDPGIDGMQILPAGRPVQNSSEILGSPKMARLAADLRASDENRIIVYDLPPLLFSDDSLVFLPNLDATLLVVQEGHAEAGEIQRSLDLLADSNLVGTVLNKSCGDNPYPYY